MNENTLEKLSTDEKIKLLTGRDYWTTESADGVKSLRLSDGPSGVRAQDGKGDCLGVNGSLPSVCYPSHSAIASGWNRELAHKVGAAIGADAAERGIDILLAPDLNVKRNPLCGRNFEYFSEDPYLNGVLGAQYSSGVQSSGVGACLKHFAANNREWGRMVCDSVVDERTLRELYLTPFEIAVKNGSPAAVMTAYNKLNGVYCSENAILNNILRGEWGFDGITISDWGGTADRAASAKAGLDIEMPKSKLSFSEVKEALENGMLDKEDIDKCAAHISGAGKRALEKSARQDSGLPLEAARECCVLLKNDGVLPLKNNTAVLVGELAEKPLFQGGGSSKVNQKGVKSLKDCLPYKYARGYISGKNGGRQQKKALKLCRGADTVIYCMGLTDDAEGADRRDLSLPRNQIDLLKKIRATGKRVVVVLYCGCAVDTSWDNLADAVLLAGLLGGSGSQAVAEILTGKVNPSGKLAETFPVSFESLPSSEYFNRSPYYTLYKEGMKVGYRAGEKVAKYPFGFGLSYTTFNYSDIEINEQGVYFTLTNTGSADGAEVAQGYIRFPENANSPFIQLKGFEKVYLKTGESKRVFIPFDEYSFRSYDASNSRWAEVTGEYEVLVASSSKDIKLKGTIFRTGDTESVAAPDTALLAPSEYPINRDKKGRVIADLRTPLCELKNAKGLFGRIFAKFSLFVVRKKRTVYGSMEYLPLRTLAQFGKMNKNVISGLITAFNGRFLKGIFTMLKREKRER